MLCALILLLFFVLRKKKKQKKPSNNLNTYFIEIVIVPVIVGSKVFKEYLYVCVGKYYAFNSIFKNESCNYIVIE